MFGLRDYVVVASTCYAFFLPVSLGGQIPLVLKALIQGLNTRLFIHMSRYFPVVSHLFHAKVFISGEGSDSSVRDIEINQLISDFKLDFCDFQMQGKC